MTKHTYCYNKHTSTPLSQLNQHWTDVLKYADSTSCLQAAKLFEHDKNTVSKHYKLWIQLGKPAMYTYTGQRRDKPSLIGDTGYIIDQSTIRCTTQSALQ